ncbi:MAG: Rpn family recombination-promoting nuclease/putative transposase [Spirochaetaceae bacterium]|jgi:predicted transposase/invertase (TIGR01784 family)|nr:Rpn family recombination-promoting nuclease/putative transposase [Spirochaetaceae bacterium]
MARFNPLNDYLFLKVMGEEGNEVQLLALLNAVLSHAQRAAITLVKIIQNRIITPEIIGDKTSILDVHAQDENGNIYEIEVQQKDFHNMEKRTLLYWAREYTESISEGMDYSVMPKVITIKHPAASSEVFCSPDVVALRGLIPF